MERSMGDTMQGWLIIQFLLVICLGSAQLSCSGRWRPKRWPGTSEARICINVQQMTHRSKLDFSSLALAEKVLISLCLTSCSVLMENDIKRNVHWLISLAYSFPLFFWFSEVSLFPSHKPAVNLAFEMWVSKTNSHEGCIAMFGFAVL